jgi:hypothetical protein
MKHTIEHALKLTGETTEQIREILDEEDPNKRVIGYITINNQPTLEIMDSNNRIHHFPLDNETLAIESIYYRHRKFAQQTENLEEGYDFDEWSYNRLKKTLIFWYRD